MSRSAVSKALLFLVLFDLTLVTWVVVFPNWWFVIFHGTAAVDAQTIAMLDRCGANWFGFLMIQIIAYFKWRDHLWLLVLVAGARLSDVLTDITCIAVFPGRSVLGLLGFPMAGIGNLLMGLYLIKAYRQLSREASGG